MVSTLPMADGIWWGRADLGSTLLRLNELYIRTSQYFSNISSWWYYIRLDRTHAYPESPPGCSVVGQRTRGSYDQKGNSIDTSGVSTMPFPESEGPSNSHASMIALVIFCLHYCKMFDLGQSLKTSQELQNATMCTCGNISIHPFDTFILWVVVAISFCS